MNEKEEGYQFLRYGFTDKEAELIQKKNELADYLLKYFEWEVIPDTNEIIWFLSHKRDDKRIEELINIIKELEGK